MQQIYRHTDEHYEVYTTVFSPQVCRSRTRSRQVGAEKVVAVTSYRSRWPKELDLNRGDLVQVLFKEDEVWWFGRLPTGHEGYFPATCVEPLQDRCNIVCPSPQGRSTQATPPLRRRVSVPAVRPAGAPCGCTSGRSTPKLLRKNSVRRSVGLDGPLESAEPGGSAAPHGSPSLLHRVLAKSRRKSCPQLPHPSSDSGAINTAFQAD